MLALTEMMMMMKEKEEMVLGQKCKGRYGSFVECCLMLCYAEFICVTSRTLCIKFARVKACVVKVSGPPIENEREDAY